MLNTALEPDAFDLGRRQALNELAGRLGRIGEQGGNAVTALPADGPVPSAGEQRGVIEGAFGLLAPRLAGPGVSGTSGRAVARTLAGTGETGG